MAWLSGTAISPDPETILQEIAAGKEQFTFHEADIYIHEDAVADWIILLLLPKLKRLSQEQHM